MREVIRGLADALAERDRQLLACRSARLSLDDRVAYLEAELRRLAGPQGAALSTQKPDWVLVGIPRPGVGVRVWASRELAGTSFDMTPMEQPPPRWVIRATMAQALTVDEPDYGAAMARVTQIWHNWDREQEASARAHAVPRPAVTRGQRSLPSGPQDSHPPVMLTDGGDDDGQADTRRT